MSITTNDIKVGNVLCFIDTQELKTFWLILKLDADKFAKLLSMQTNEIVEPYQFRLSNFDFWYKVNDE